MRNGKTRLRNSFSGGFASEKDSIGMNGADKLIFALGVLCAIAALPGCKTTETTMTSHASSVAAASAGSVAVSVSTEAATVTRTAAPPPPSPPPAVDVISGEKKPCGTVAPDAPKFVELETAK